MASHLIRNFRQEDREQVLILLGLLQNEYKASVCPDHLAALTEDKDPSHTLEVYFDHIVSGEASTCRILVAEDRNGRLVGFAIGRVAQDADKVLGTIGVFEDWYVKPDHREEGIGRDLYLDLERWFVEMNCRQAASEAWINNVLGRRAHEKLGFLEYSVTYRKRLPG